MTASEGEVAFRCKGCGEIDSIVVVSVVPREFGVVAVAKGEWEQSEVTDNAFWEAEATVGYGCHNVECPHWQGHLGVEGNLDDGSLHVVTGPRSPEVIAEYVQPPLRYSHKREDWSR